MAEIEFAILISSDNTQQCTGQNHGDFYIFRRDRMVLDSLRNCAALLSEIPKNGWILLFTLLTGLLIANVLLKNLVARVRPYDVNTAVNLLISKPTDWSFPSGHTTASFGAAAALLYADKKFGIAAYIIAAIIAFSRMYLYVHYPTDILGGIAVGTLSFFIVITVYKHINWEKAASRLHNKS